MKKIFVMFAMAALVLASCAKEESPLSGNDGQNDAFEPSGELVEKVFTVGEIKSKTYIDGTVEEGSGHLVLKWCADDAISVWDGVANRKFTMVGEPDGASATFKGYVDAAATEFFAFYPYTETLAHKVASSKHVFSFPKSKIQYANPEGGLADGAAFACAKVEDNKINFAANSCMLKFSLAEGMEVKSITIKGNETDDILAGTTNFTYDSDKAKFSPGFEQSVEKFTELTLCNQDGSNLKTGTDYYLAMQGNEYKAGFTVSLALADGTVYSKSSSKAIQYMSGSIYPLSAKPLSHGMFDYYKGYLAGEDIVIGGKVYNKKTHPNAKLLTETTTISAKGLYFLAPGEGQTITLGTTNVADIAIVGNDPSKRVTIQHSGFRLNSRAKVASKNIVFPAVEQQYIQEASDGAEYVVYDNCKIVASSKPMCYNEASSVQTIGEFIMVNSEYEVPKAIAESTGGAFIFNSYLPNSDLYFDNNIFYVDTPDLSTLKFKISTKIDFTINSVIMTNNTFVNMLANGGDNGYFKTGVLINSITANNNLFYVPAMTRNNYVFMNGLEDASATTLNNVCYTNDNTYDFYMFGANSSTPAGAQMNITKLSASPFSSMDHTNGVFVKTDEAAAYGAKR